MQKIIISLTILPSRLKNSQKCIQSLLSQDTKPDAIYIWHPQNCRRDKTVVKEMPPYLQNPLIHNLKVEDMGPITKILPSLKKEWNNKDTIIITADDDVIYPKNWVSGLVEASDKSPNSVFCYRGRNFRDKQNPLYAHTNLVGGHRVKKNTEVDIVTGTWGALYKPQFFKEEFFDVDLSSKFFFVDDIWISGQLKKHGVKAYVTHTPNPITPDENNNVTSLWEINRVSDNNDYGIQYFKEYFKK